VSRGKSALGIVQKYHPEVTKVVDARKNLEIEVTESDCKYAQRKNAKDCAMARATKRQYDGAIISSSSAYVIKGDTATRYKVPESLAREIVTFDRHNAFEPGDYHLKAPSPRERLGQRLKTREIGTYKKNGRETNSRRHVTSGIREL
jgi:hypothetical protein